MEVEPVRQATAFGVMCLCGAAAGLGFDFFRAMRRIVPMNRAATGACDLLFWLLFAALAFWCADTFNRGELRLFEFCGIALGAAGYALLFSRAAVRAMEQLLRGGCFCVRLLLRPLVWLIRAVKRAERRSRPLRKKLRFAAGKRLRICRPTRGRREKN